MHRAALAVGLVAGCPACGLVLGASDYEVANDGAGGAGGADGAGGAGTVELPLLPARPDAERLDACEQCVEEQCVDQRRACLESPQCRALLACMGSHGEGDGCSDPNCIYRCRDTLPESLAFAEYFSCAFSWYQWGAPAAACSTECIGDGNWDCVEHYDWDAWEGPTALLEVRTHSVEALQAGPLGAMQNAEVAACSDLTTGPLSGDRNCQGWTPLDAYGGAPLEVGEWRSAIAVRGGLGEQHRYYQRPIARGGVVDLLLFRTSVMVPFLSDFVQRELEWPGLDPERGLLLFRPYDCLATAAAPVRVEITGGGGATRAYWGSGAGDLDLAATEGTWGVFIDADTGSQVEVTVTAMMADGSEHLVARRKVLVAPGWLTHADMFPLARFESR